MNDSGNFHALDKQDFEARATELREALLDAQFEAREAKSEALLILLNGPDGAGKGEVLNRLHEWLDPRPIRTMAYDINEEAEHRRPAGWRYWRDMPVRGRIGIVLGSWYHAALLRRVTGEIDGDAFGELLARFRRLEAMLAADGVRVLKLWLHLSADKAAARFRAKRDDPGSPRRPLLREWRAVKGSKARRRLVAAAEEMVAATGTEAIPWHVVPASDPLARDLAVGELVHDALHAAADRPPPRRTKPPSRPRRFASGPAVLPGLDLGQRLEHAEYKDRLDAAQQEIYRLTRRKAFGERGMVLVFEGNDAAGKGGTIRRLRSALDPLASEIHSIGAPSDTSLAHPWLWRFWRRIPDRGRIAIFDRSWYGRVLVERVEGFAARADWSRAYGEINDFERRLTDGGFLLHKFWLAIDADEQLARFKAREEVPHKRFKITDEDWRNREKWPLYEAAVEDMVALTDTGHAHWTLVESNDKRFGRVKVLETVVDRLKEAL